MPKDRMTVLPLRDNSDPDLQQIILHGLDTAITAHVECQHCPISPKHGFTQNKLDYNQNKPVAGQIREHMVGCYWRMKIK